MDLIDGTQPIYFCCVIPIIGQMIRPMMTNNIHWGTSNTVFIKFYIPYLIRIQFLSLYCIWLIAEWSSFAVEQWAYNFITISFNGTYFNNFWVHINNKLSVIACITNMDYLPDIKIKRYRIVSITVRVELHEK